STLKPTRALCSSKSLTSGRTVPTCCGSCSTRPASTCTSARLSGSPWSACSQRQVDEPARLRCPPSVEQGGSAAHQKLVCDAEQLRRPRGAGGHRPRLCARD